MVTIWADAHTANKFSLVMLMNFSFKGGMKMFILLIALLQMDSAS